MNNFKIYINKLNTLHFIVFSSFLAYISTIPFSIISYLINYNDNFNVFFSNSTILNFILFIFFAVLFGPLIESILIIFIIKIINKFFRNNTLTIMLSSTIFSGLHYNYGYLHVLALLIPSLIFIYAYFFYEQKNKYVNPFIILTTIHSLYNLYNILFSNFF
jgi:hypothetical protein